MIKTLIKWYWYHIVPLFNSQQSTVGISIDCKFVRSGQVNDNNKKLNLS